MERIVNNHIKFLKHVINSVWISDGESLAKLYEMLDKSEIELNELRGLI
ncbi:hypothetical protein IMAU40072_00664 [Lactiplantibacillus plantarum]|nr:hypothetical protein [Lactiplantibacillus plantarum]MCG0593766.1 hypothetical protein [Lactiplantibacillus plantarum]MCG0623044.1 hypothetical protein [Lactiplantibacillus plantarum]MCG0750031.1 hypothetical protein [Lactiplantibacillus plantarum]MCG0758660.1 hypothetical protein [Lactiplantibacillus plantarum]MCG0885760.1 hypothetical protein [Lactiplantibacillus plantarum]